jgi:anhydro-N-acetylmuramic acid kinase
MTLNGMNSSYHVLGLMSGTSLDGLDVAICTFELSGQKWHYAIEKTTTYPYSPGWKKKLSEAEHLSGIDLILLHNEYGELIGKYVNQFLDHSNSKIDFIASHGQTIFHQPKKGLTLQIGNGANISAITGITTICDFRTLDVALGGQGAPLVPIGDELLFGDFDFCLNLGGFANISYHEEGNRIAFDICPVNILINQLVSERNLSFDPEGSIGRKGNVSTNLLNELNSLAFYQKPGPKSLGKEWVWNQVLPIINRHKLSLEDTLRTIYEHIIFQTRQILQNKSEGTMLTTGGGAHNQFLMELFQQYLKIKIVIPSKEIVDFKEALIFAFLGVLRFRNEVNCLCSATGARMDNIGGIIYKVAF